MYNRDVESNLEFKITFLFVLVGSQTGVTIPTSVQVYLMTAPEIRAMRLHALNMYA